MVGIKLSSSDEMQAVVSARDERNFLAKLEPVSLDSSSRNLARQNSAIGNEHSRFNIGPVAAHGDPLFTTDGASETPIVIVAGMAYSIRVSELKEDEPNMWRFDPKLPQGLVGGGVWNLDGQFIGLSLGRKIPLVESLTHDRLFALPAEAVMNFAETK
jgi:hypothetical protein